MGNRLSKIVTRTGDNGITGLGDGSRAPKHATRIQAMGEVDELNSHLGLLLCEPLDTSLLTLFTHIQHDLFDLGAELSIPGYHKLRQEQVLQLDDWLAHYNAQLAPLTEFILPGGCRAAAQTHVCRTICRRAERQLVLLAETESVSDKARQYLNRLSDLLFILARVMNQLNGCGDVLWKNK